MMRPSLFAWAALAPFLAGCATTAIRGDLDQVRAYAAVASLPSLEDTSDDGILELLAQPIGEEEAVRIALARNGELRATLQSLGVARGELVQVGLLPNPTFEIEALPERNTAIELRVEYDLTALLLRPMATRAAARALESERYRAASAVLGLAYEVRIAFLDLLAAEQRFTIAVRALDAFAASREAAEALLNVGNVSVLMASRPIAEHERARAKTARLELELLEKREAMNRLLGLHGASVRWRSKGELPPAPERMDEGEALEAKVIAASLELKASGAQIQASSYHADAARAEGWIPDIAADVHTLYGDPEDPGDSQWRFGFGLSVALPLFDRRQGDVAKSEAQMNAELQRREGRAVTLRSSTRVTRSRLASAHARAVLYQTTILPAQKRVVEESMRQYNAMQVSLFELLDAHRATLDAELEYVDTLKEMWSARAALDTLLAGRQVDPMGSSEATPASMAGSGSAGGH